MAFDAMDLLPIKTTMILLHACEKASSEVEVVTAKVDVYIQCKHAAICTWMLKLSGIVDSDKSPLRERKMDTWATFRNLYYRCADGERLEDDDWKALSENIKDLAHKVMLEAPIII